MAQTMSLHAISVGRVGSRTTGLSVDDNPPGRLHRIVLVGVGVGEFAIGVRCMTIHARRNSRTKARKSRPRSTGDRAMVS